MQKNNEVSNDKQKLIRRLKKIEGQVKGIQRMIESNKNCVDILVQIAAAKAAINKVGLLILKDHTHGCVSKAIKEQQDEKIDELINVLEKFMK